MFALLKEMAACYTGIRVVMKAGLLDVDSDTTPGEVVCECVAAYATGIACAILMPVTAPIGVVWAARDAYVHRDTIIEVGHDTLAWCKDKVHNIKASWRKRGALEVEHATAVGEN